MLVNERVFWWSGRAGQFTQHRFILLAGTPATILLHQYALIDQHTDDLFNKKWIALSAALNGMV